jgi:solute carrier family 25 S-adenosylmethionine transporter 26
VLTAAVGAVPSSALYFGAYEISKNAIRRRFAAGTAAGEEEPFLRRLWIHAAAAATGNVISSAVFVPKELIKQQMQYHAGRTSVRQTVRLILRKSGIRGLYCGYSTVLLRNIPSAALRFCLYEEFRRAWYDEQSDGAGAGAGQWSWKLFAAGAVAGAIASGVMTPVDVLKTRLSTGTCPIVTDPLGGNPVVTCVQHVVRENGWKALYAGAGSRMLFSGAFSAVGFGTFEAAKKWLRVSPSSPVNKQ